MRAHVRDLFARQSVEVFFYSQAAPGQLLHYWLKDGEWVSGPIKEGTWPEQPSLVLPREMLQALVDESEEVLEPDGATNRHLKDAVKVRDRLLSLVESVVVAPTEKP